MPWALFADLPSILSHAILSFYIPKEVRKLCLRLIQVFSNEVMMFVAACNCYMERIVSDHLSVKLLGSF